MLNPAPLITELNRVANFQRSFKKEYQTTDKVAYNGLQAESDADPESTANNGDVFTPARTKR
jgi:hypothetical protein